MTQPNHQPARSTHRPAAAAAKGMSPAWARRALAASAAVAASTLLGGCDQARALYTQTVTTPEQRMASRACGGAAPSDRAALGIAIGMPLSEALAVLRCYDPKASLEFGTSGQGASDAHKFLRERSGGSSGYTNLAIWTRGTTRPCTRTGEANGSALSDALKPDDLKFEPWVATGGSSGSGFQCFAQVSDQIALLADGAPGQQTVAGLWRVHVPADGKRPSLDGTLEALASQYPALNTAGAARTSKGLAVEGFVDAAGRKLDAPQIRSDFVHLTSPVAPTPPKTTESCGFLWMNTCSRVPTAEEQASHARASTAYEQQLKAYQQRRPVADAYHRCVSTPPATPLERSVALQDDKPCGLAYFAAAKAYPGGFAEAYFLGIYSHPEAQAGAQQLAQHLQQFRGLGNASAQKPML